MLLECVKNGIWGEHVEAAEQRGCQRPAGQRGPDAAQLPPALLSPESLQ